MRNAVALIVVIAICIYLIATQASRSERRLAEKARAVATTGSPYVANLRYALTIATRGTRLENRWSLNGPASSDGLSVYLLDSDQPASRAFFVQYPSLAGNCAASPSGKLI